ncbi:Oidioi.mRNA.OKI2018_I69.PAR.g12970.t1.cds [Oikopleura dioica]|uniref:Oidioi.mRNA.OKI2018_I69.PAR.g12970.t1.cds n=1 Tax=Oikopleura dioica TaxID=34765 RepID=A0ABN7S620_OIKDI|nr:Oidioi.mRNA.OKI2018_I69.PAR.g12970.t1.cds [Oikopleura dioica]
MPGLFMEWWYMILLCVSSLIVLVSIRFGYLFLPRVLQVKQIQTLSKQGAHLVTNRKVTMFITIIGTAIIATFQLFTVILDNFLPKEIIPCPVLTYLTVCLHPLLTFFGVNMLLFVRQMFTLRTLRQTPLKYFIITMASTVSAMVASTLFLAFGGLVFYLLYFDRHDNQGWIITRIDPEDDGSHHSQSTCLFKSEVSVTLVLLSALGNMALLLFCSIWDVIPFIRYVWYRYTCQLPKAHKYIEILAFKLLAASLNLMLSIPILPIMCYCRNIVAFSALSWILYSSILSVMFFSEGEFRQFANIKFLEPVVQNLIDLLDTHKGMDPDAVEDLDKPRKPRKLEVDGLDAALEKQAQNERERIQAQSDPIVDIVIEKVL